VIDGERLPHVLIPETVTALLSEGWTWRELRHLVDSILNDADHWGGFTVERDVPKRLYRELAKVGDEGLVAENRIVEIPSRVVNAMLCDEISTRFNANELRSCDCFIEKVHLDEQGIYHSSWRLDVETRYRSAGFLVPLYDREGLIFGLKVFRYPHDPKPFRLKTRSIYF
jgi:hypothetical protein